MRKNTKKLQGKIEVHVPRVWTEEGRQLENVSADRAGLVKTHVQEMNDPIVWQNGWGKGEPSPAEGEAPKKSQKNKDVECYKKYGISRRAGQNRNVQRRS